MHIGNVVQGSRACFVVIVLLLAGAAAAQPTVQDPTLEVQTVVTGLSNPTTMAFIGDDDFLVLQQFDGRVRRVVAGVLQPGEVLDVPVDISVSDRGLLGIATDPNFINNRHVFLLYTEADVDGGESLGTRVYRYRWDGAQLVEPHFVLELPNFPDRFRIGGIVTFGPDDMLYVTTGDQMRLGKLQNLVERRDPDDTSVILRTYPSGDAPPDNPFFGLTDGLAPMERYWSYGLRNCYGLAFDPVSGDMWNTENGTSEYDEINRIPAGANGGWVRLQGPVARGSGMEDFWFAPGAFYNDPQFSWFDPIAPTAIAFIETPKLGCQREDRMLVASTNCDELYLFELNTGRDGILLSAPELQDEVADNLPDRCVDELDELRFAAGMVIPTDIETGPDGLVYVVSLIDGAVYRIAPLADPVGDADGDGVNAACDCDPGDGGSWGVPGDLGRLRLVDGSPGQTRLGWDDQRARAGSATTYSVVAGTLSELLSDGDFRRACTLASGLTESAAGDLLPDPSPGEATYYLVRGGNSCSNGTYGDASISPDPRDALDLALPVNCL